MRWQRTPVVPRLASELTGVLPVLQFALEQSAAYKTRSVNARWSRRRW
jgi:hypothetical protein